MSSDQEFTESEADRFQALLDAIYEDFVGKVAAGRGKSFDEAEAIARGRVWAGSDAHDLGLVDALGGLRAAVDLAREAAGLEAGKAHRLTVMPKPKSPLVAMIGRDSRDDDRVALREMLNVTAPLAELAGGAASLSPGAALTMPGIRTEL
jgi:protease-4